MILMIFFALICALSTVLVLQPIAMRHKKSANALLFVIPALALGAYFILGSPNLPASPAMFETDPEIIEARLSVTRELDTMRELSQNPQDTQLIMRLAGIRMSQGKFDDTISLLQGAVRNFPDDDMLKTQLGAAYYTKSLLLMQEKDFAQSLQALQLAQKSAPQNAPFMEDINALLPELQKLQ